MTGFSSWITLPMTSTALPASVLMTEAIFTLVVTMSPTWKVEGRHHEHTETVREGGPS